MNAIIIIGGQDVTASCILDQTKLVYDSSRVITTATVTVLMQSHLAVARYDYAHYDQDRYGFKIDDLMPVVIYDGRDGTTKLFAGQVYKIDHAQTDAPGLPVLHTCTMLDYAAWLDRSVCQSTPAVVFPTTDAQLIQTLMAAWCPNIDATDVTACFSPLQSYDYVGKTCRQLLDDMAGYANAMWTVDFDGKLHYGPPSDAPQAPFELSTSPDNSTSFQFRLDQYTRDFTNPVNKCVATGALDPSTGVAPTATYSDPVSIQYYGEYDFAIIDSQITNANDAQLRAKTQVLKYAYALEQGQFVIWKDGLKLGQQVHLHDDVYGIDGWYVITALQMQWKDQTLVEYQATVGAMQPDLVRYLRLLDQANRWKSNKPVAGVPAAGSVTDASIAAPGLSAQSIQSVNANVINGQVQAQQIGSVNAGVIAGVITSTQGVTVAAGTLQGVITGPNVSVNATTITGVVVSSQLANGIIDSLSKYTAATQPIPLYTNAQLAAAPKPLVANSYFYITDSGALSLGHFYQVNAAGTGWTDAGTNPATLTGALQFYNIGAMNAQSLVGLIVAAQIQNITAGQVTGQLQANQIGTVNASTIQGTLTASQIAAVNATAIQGLIQAAQINTVTASQVTGTFQGSQIQNIVASTITIGLIGSNQINTVNASQLVVGTANAQTVQVYASDNQTVIGRIGVMTGGLYGGWFKVWGAGGSDYTSANAYTDAGGNLFLKNANFNVQGGSSTLQTAPAYYDQTYSSLALNMGDGASSVSMVSRGLVFYASGSKIGSLVKSPNGTYLELEFTVGGGYTLINGAAGVRSDAGYKVQGWPVIDSNGAHYAGAYGKFVDQAGSATFAFVSSSSGFGVGATGSYQVNGVQVIDFQRNGNFAAIQGASLSVSGSVGAAGYNCAGGTGQTWTGTLADPTGGHWQLTFKGGVLTAVAQV